jgi:hypothetical protein
MVLFYFFLVCAKTKKHKTYRNKKLYVFNITKEKKMSKKTTDESMCFKKETLLVGLILFVLLVRYLLEKKEHKNKANDGSKDVVQGYTTVSGSGGGGMFKSIFAAPPVNNFMNYSKDERYKNLDRYDTIPSNRDSIPTPRHSASGTADIGARARYRPTGLENMAANPDDPLLFHEIIQENQNHSDEFGRGYSGHAEKINGMFKASGMLDHAKYPDVEDSMPIGDMTNSHSMNLIDPTGKVRNPVYVNSLMGGFVSSNVKPERQSGDPALMIRGSAPINSDTNHFKNWERADMFLPHQAKMDQMRSLAPGAFHVFGETDATQAHRALKEKYTKRAREAMSGT